MFGDFVDFLKWISFRCGNDLMLREMEERYHKNIFLFWKTEQNSDVERNKIFYFSNINFQQERIQIVRKELILLTQSVNIL